MPYLGVLDGEEVLPPQVHPDTIVTCPACEGAMSVVKSYPRDNSFVSRHFRHKSRTQVEIQAKGQAALSDLNEVGACPGESDIHKKMKSIAYDRLEHEFPNSTVDLERGLDGRIPDVMVSFSSPRAPYGEGVAIEAQYRNLGKDIDGATEHYFDHGYSVAWLTEDDYSARDVDLSGIQTLWPHALPDRTGLEGYSSTIQDLRNRETSSVELEIPIPGEYWKSLDQSGEWTPIAQRDLRANGNASIKISKSPDGFLTLLIGKKSWEGDGAENVSVQVSPNDCSTLRSVVDELEEVGFPTVDKSYLKRREDWPEISKSSLEGTATVSPEVSAVVSPDGAIVIGLEKSDSNGEESVMTQIDRTGITAIREIVDLLELAFSRESNK